MLEKPDLPDERIIECLQDAYELCVGELEFLPIGADLNTVPPESTMRSGYPAEPKTDHADDVTLARLRAVDGWQEALTEDAYLADEASYFTFPAHAPNRKLDYLFTGTGYEVVDFHVLKDAGDVSDHLPIFAELRVKTPE